MFCNLATLHLHWVNFLFRYRILRSVAQVACGIATGWAGQPGNLIPVGARFSASVQAGPGAHPASCTMGTGSFPGVKSGRRVTLTSHPLLVPLVIKE